MEILSMRLTSDASAPRRARQAVAERLADHPRSEELLLCVSEVVTNAVLHTTSPQRMSVSQDASTVRVEVADGDAHAPLLGDHDPFATSGRGLLILDKLALRWGHQPTREGKAVWFEFER
jgi:anti-sigma regulatory factor (Ser/Thr protein kinase)